MPNCSATYAEPVSFWVGLRESVKPHVRLRFGQCVQATVSRGSSGHGEVLGRSPLQMTPERAA
jgi:hypothetical protein